MLPLCLALHVHGHASRIYDAAFSWTDETTGIHTLCEDFCEESPNLSVYDNVCLGECLCGMIMLHPVLLSFVLTVLSFVHTVLSYVLTVLSFVLTILLIIKLRSFVDYSNVAGSWNGCINAMVPWPLQCLHQCGLDIVH